MGEDLRALLGDPRQAAMLRERAERIFADGITLFTEGDVIAAWTPLVGRPLARQLIDTLAFAERLEDDEFALLGELTLIAEDCYRAWSTELDTDGREWRQLQWSYTERRGHRTTLFHIARWDGEVVEFRSAPEGLARLIRRLVESQLESVRRGAPVDHDELAKARDLLTDAIDTADPRDG